MSPRIHQEVVKPQRPSILPAAIHAGLLGLGAMLILSTAPGSDHEVITVVTEPQIVGVEPLVPRPSAATPTQPPDAPETQSRVSFKELGLVMRNEARTFVTLPLRAQRRWGRGKVRGVGDSFESIIMQRARIPSELLPNWRHEVTLFDSDGRSCTGRLGGTFLVQQISGETGDQPVNDFLDWDDEGRVTKAAYQVLDIQGGCKNPVLVTAQREHSFDRATTSELTASERKDIKKAFRGTSRYAEIQREHKKYGGAGFWDTADVDETFQRIAFKSEVYFYYQRQPWDCGEPGGPMAYLFSRDADGTLRQINVEGLPMQLSLLGDLDGDGDLDIAARGDGYDRYLLEQQDGAFLKRAAIEVPIMYCRC